MSGRLHSESQPSHLPARVFKAGNSLAIRIPSIIAKSIGLGEGSAVEVALEDGRILVKPSAPPRLADLIERITPENVHGEAFEKLSERERW